MPELILCQKEEITPVADAIRELCAVNEEMSLVSMRARITNAAAAMQEQKELIGQISEALGVTPSDSTASIEGNTKLLEDLLDSNTALIEQFLSRNRKEDAMFYVTSMIYDAYFTMNKDEWLNQENKEYRHATERRFKEYWFKYKQLHDETPLQLKNQVIMALKNRMYMEGMILESLTFNEWIKQVEAII